MMFLAIFIPIFNGAIGETTSTNYIDSFNNKILSSSPLTILLNIVALPLWTFGLNHWINIIILLPLRVIGLVSLWFIIAPSK